jgi:SAM-dependent methyltransferase
MESAFYEDYYRHEISHWWFRWRYDLITGLVASLKRNDSFRILDAGCGTGQMTTKLGEIGEAFGLDSALEAITFARSRGVGRLVRGSITAPPFAEGSFDCALALDVIEHVDDDMGILTSLFHVVKPGGSLIITVPAFDSLWSEHDEINHHKRRYRASQLHLMIQEAGFDVERVTYCNTALYVPVLVTRKVKNAWRGLSRKWAGEQRPLQSDLGDYPRPVNDALYLLMKAEMRLMQKFDMPFGVSILAVATRPYAPAQEQPPLDAKANGHVPMPAVPSLNGSNDTGAGMTVGAGAGPQFDSSAN